jgi:CubicO group peptidase (beta-lactamase class C family)
MRLIAATTALLFAALTGNASGADTARAELTRADVEAWLDGFVPYAMGTADIAGGVIVVVKGGEVIAQKGYGYADVATKRPVDPERTLFRAGSVAKLVTHTAAMQLVEQGKLDLDGDITQYLDLPVPQAFGKPVTLHNLMTHTGGFEELVRGLMASDPQRFMPLETYIKATKPARIFPPGEVPSYCNYCVALEGYIVQRVSGEDFDDYLDKHVFAPLGMTSSTFRQPLPAQFKEHMSSGYSVASQSQPPAYFELVGPAPAGSLSTTGADMARFMIAHLHAFAGTESNLLRPETAQRMQTTMFQPVPPSVGMAVGFFERDRNGHRIREHGGDTQFFHSKLAMFMDDDAGIFMSFNSTGKEGAAGTIREAIVAQFADRYYPAPLPELTKSPQALERAQLVAGRYAVSRRAETTFFKLFTLLGQTNIAPNAEGALSMPGLNDLNGQPKKWYEAAPFAWREGHGPEHFAAKMDGQRVQMLSADEVGGILVLLPVPWQQSGAWIVPTMLVAVVILVLTALAWPISAWRRRRRGTPLALSPRELSVYRIARVVALVDVAFLSGWTLLISAGNADLAAYDGHLDWAFYALHLLGLIGAVGAIVALWNGWLAIAGKRGWKAATWNIGLAASCVAVSWFAFAFHLIRFTLRY